MATKLYVGGVPYSSTDDTLKDHFSQAGNVVSANIIMDRMSGRSKGFGFVEMPNDNEAEKAIEALDGSDMQGRNIKVNQARPKKEYPPRSPRF